MIKAQTFWLKLLLIVGKSFILLELKVVGFSLIIILVIDAFILIISKHDIGIVLSQSWCIETKLAILFVKHILFIWLLFWK